MIPVPTRRLVEDACTILLHHAPERGSDIIRLRQAVGKAGARAKILSARLRILIDNARPGNRLSRHEQYCLGSALAALDEIEKLGRPGNMAWGHRYAFIVYLNEEFGEAIRTHCQEHGLSRSQVIRDALAEHLDIIAGSEHQQPVPDDDLDTEWLNAPEMEGKSSDANL